MPGCQGYIRQPVKEQLPAMNLYEYLDSVRRWQGAFLDVFGLGPQESPSRTVFSRRLMTLKVYGGGQPGGPVLLIVPAPIKRAYIWDIAPGASVVRECLRSGIRVYMIHWKEPGPDDQEAGLDEYAGSFIASCLDAVGSETREKRVFIAGHSLGGTLSAIFTSRFTGRVRGLILVGAPLQFGPDVGELDAMIAKSPKAEDFTKKLGNVPGAFVGSMSSAASPESFRKERFHDWFLSLTDPEAWQMHMRVERWTLDEMPMPRRLFEQVMEFLYREDRFMKARLTIDGRTAVPAGVRSPILSIADKRSRVVSPQASLAFHDAAASIDKKVLWYNGDVGVALQHIGMLVGKNAHQYLWPEIIAWIHAHSHTE